MDRKNLQDDGLDLFAKGVAELIGDYADVATTGAGPRPRSFAPLAERVMRKRRRNGAKQIVVACAALCAVVGLWAQRRLGDHQREALTYTVNGQLPLYTGYMDAGSTGEPVLAFSDGTRVRLGPRARGRVVELGRHGARIALDEGNAHVEVAHRPGADWLFEAGPFLISVHGTAFTFGWNTHEARLDVKMDSGVVSVTGPLSGGEIFLRAGQTLSIGLNDRAMPSLDSKVEATGAIPPLAEPAPSPVSTPTPGSFEPSVRSTGRSHPAESWVAQLADGKAAEIVADAERRGLTKSLDSSNSEELAALADAFRYERQDRLARRALLAQRRRFPGSTRAAEASFLLGRIDEDSHDGTERALGWYDRYLEEAPRGAYVSEALGRKMMVLEWTHSRAEATKIATDYLRRFPGGTYSHAAKALVRSL